jgi:hypothetical protein
VVAITLLARTRSIGESDETSNIVQGYPKRNINFQKIILQKLLTLNQCPVYGWKGNLSSSDIDDRKQRITEAVAAVNCDLLRLVWEELDYRFDICRVTRGAHIQCL